MRLPHQTPASPHFATRQTMYQAMLAGMWPPGDKLPPSSPMEFIWNSVPSSGVLVQGGVEKLERDVDLSPHEEVQGSWS